MQSGAFSLIEDYHRFSSPSRIAINGDTIAVFDEGAVALITEKGEISTFQTEVAYAHSIFFSEAGVFLLSGSASSITESESARVLRYSLSGEKLSFELTMDHLTDIAVSGNRLFTLSDMRTVTTFDFSGAEVIRTSFTLPFTRSSFFLFADGDDLYFKTAAGKLLKKEGESFIEVFDLSSGLSADSRSFAVSNGEAYFLKDGSVYKNTLSSPVLPSGEKDDAVSLCVDFCLSGENVFALDSFDKAVKAFDRETGKCVRFIGSSGKNLGRLNAPTALSVKDGAIAVADRNERVSVFANGTVRALSGYPISSVSAIANANGIYYLATGSSILEYTDLLFEKEYVFGSGAISCVAASADGSVFASSGNVLFVKKKGDPDFAELVRQDRSIEKMTVGIGGKVVYLYSGGAVRAFTQEGDPLSGSLDVSFSLSDFAVDYRGNLFLLSEEGKIVRYFRTLGGYFSPTEFSLPSDYEVYRSLAIEKDGTMYVTADHNVIGFEKNRFGVFTRSDSDFKDEAPDASPLFVCEVKSDSSIAYVAPDNFEDVTYLPQGAKLLCYASLRYGGFDYLRVETEKGIAYLPKGDVTVFSAAPAPMKNARCLHTKIGVNLYRRPSYIEIEKGEEPLFSSLGKTEIFEVVSLVAGNEEGSDEWGFYIVRYQGETAYARVTDVVSVDQEPTPITRYKAKIKAEKLGKPVVLYKDASVESEEVVRLPDGTELYAIEPIDKEKEFTKVIYKGETCYVLTRYLGTGGLSGGQTLAIVISVVTVFASIATALILRAGKKRKMQYKE